MPDTDTTERQPHNPDFERAWIAPKYWILWFWLGSLWIITRFPAALVFSFGRGLGLLMFHLMKKRRHIVDVNLRLCFPDMDEDEREAMARENFAQWGITIFESGWVWWSNPRGLSPRFDIENIEPTLQLIKQKQPVIIMGYHTACLELAYTQLGLEIPYNVLFRVNSNPVWEYAANCGRRRYPIRLLPRKQIKNLLQRLSEGEPGLIIADHDMGPKHSLFAPFCGIQAAVVTTVPDIAAQVGAKVVFCDAYRVGTRYKIHLSDPLENFPSDNLQADAERQSAIFEEAARQHPEQYMWMHRRFKTRPPGEKKLY